MAVSPEALLISSVIKTQDVKTALAEGAVEDMFHVHNDEWEWIARFFSKYRKAPSKLAFTRAFPKFRIRDVDDIKHFVSEVKIEHTRARLTEHLRDQADLLSQGKVQEACELAQSGIVKIAGDMGGSDEVDVLADWKSTYNEVKARKLRAEQFGQSGVPTGMSTLDEFTGGVGPGQLWVVGARLGEGKSWMLAAMACGAITGGYKAHFAALEMSKTEVTMRLHNLLSSSYGRAVFQSVQLSQGKGYDLKSYRRFLEDLPNQIKGSITVTDTRNIGAMEIAAHLERNKPDVYYLDYLTLAKTRGDGGWQDIGHFSKDLKQLAGQYGVGMVAAAQLNRSGSEPSKEPPGAETIAQADAIGQDADAVITLKKRSDRVTMAKMAKYRHGRSGYCWYMHVDLDNGLIEEVSKNRAEDIMDQDADRRDKLMEEMGKGPKARKRSEPVSTSKIKSTQQETLAGASGRKLRRRIK
ncbi:putative helicase [Gordonia phage GMA6]|uniref:Putative helicase n=1 Tax=Gordonia phage GMA6 TaxID=1647285 RepID=A0A0K0NL74_9CAUD|nr:putative helicase [Gordonia phage GMA6]AKL88333.1 putative helicase [Gordonia phage GMA6]